MFSISDSLTLAATFGSFLLGFIVLFKDPRKLLNVTFSIFSLATVLWILSNFIFEFYGSSLIIKSQYALGALIMPLAIIWVYILVDGTISKKRIALIAGIGLLFSVPIFFGDHVISQVIIENGKTQIITGSLFNYFGVCIFIVFAFFIYKLITGIRKAKDKVVKIQLRFTMWGVVLFAGISVFVGFVLPFFDILIVGPYDAQSSLFFVTLSAYAILRHKLFNLKIITTELLVSAIWMFLLIKILLSSSLTDIVVNTTLFILMLLLGTLLMKSVNREVSQREKIEILATDLQKANERLTELDRQKSEFVSFATHQLRAPLTAMKGYASLILEGDMGKVPDQAKEAVGRIFESTNTLTNIVDDYLNVTRIELGTMKYAFETIDLKTLIEDVIAELKPNIDKATNVKFLFGAENAGTDYRITADRDKLKQVIANLIDNSLKYTPKGSVGVSLSFNRSKHKFVFMLKDTGIGIAPETLPHLFNKFTRAGNANKTNIKGTGLGLFVAKEIITAHHGTIRAESEGEGKGSSFIVELEPFAKA